MIATATHLAPTTGRPLLIAFGLLLTGGLVGCTQREEKVPVRHAHSALPWGMTIAVAPALNHSGSPAFDPLRVSDLMASELATIPGVQVIGVNRVLAILAEQGVTQIGSPQHALTVCQRTGADAILVYAVTEYDPYQPVVGMTAQLYGPQPTSVGYDPVTGSRSARPSPMPERIDSLRPWAQVQRVFNGVHDEVRERVREYASDRNEKQTPYGWEKYLASQEWYLRFCCYEVLAELVQQPPPVMEQAAAPQEAG